MGKDGATHNRKQKARKQKTERQERLMIGEDKTVTAVAVIVVVALLVVEFLAAVVRFAL